MSEKSIVLLNKFDKIHPRPDCVYFVEHYPNSLCSQQYPGCMKRSKLHDFLHMAGAETNPKKMYRFVSGGPAPGYALKSCLTVECFLGYINIMNMTEALRNAIPASGWSLKALERETGVDRLSIARFLSGETSLILNKADLLADLLGLDVSQKRPVPPAPDSRPGRPRRSK